MKTIGYAAHSAEKDLVPFSFERRSLKDNDVAIEILYSGICHSDLHTVKGDWGEQTYPLIPGHEIIGKVIEVGSSVKKFKIGESVGVGCMVDSCQTCDQCEKSEEMFCRSGLIATYGSEDKHMGGITQGGYSKHIVVREEFVLKVSEKLDLSKAAPILCAGITMYTPLKKWHVSRGTRVGIVGFGGLGHMGVKLAVAMGAEVTVITRSKGKEDVAKSLGAKGILVSSDEDAMEKAGSSFDVILDTVPVKHDFNTYTPLLDVDGTLVLVGQIGEMEEPLTLPLIFGRRRIAGSLIGGIKDTQEVLDFCAEHGIHPDCEHIEPSQVNEAWAKLLNENPAHRYVMNMESLSLK